MSLKSYKTENTKALILAGGRDFGRCPLTSRLPVALWPVADKPVLQHLLEYLSQQGIKQAVVCSNGDACLLQKSIGGINSMELSFLDEQLPVGTAGCIRDATCGETDALLLVLPGNMLRPPRIDMLIHAHRQGRSDLTVVLDPPTQQNGAKGKSTGIYICEPAILQYIPEDGYYDIKESLIPNMLRAGKNVHAFYLDQPVGNFRNHEEYLYAIADYLENANKESFGLPIFKHNASQTLWMASDCNIDSSARIYGPVVVMTGAVISKGSVVFGPTIIGRNVDIGQDSLIADSALWDGSSVGKNCQVQRCVIDNNAVIPQESIVEEQAVPYRQKTILQISIGKTADFVNDKTEKSGLLLQKYSEKFNKLLNLPKSENSGKNILAAFAMLILFAAFLWSYWPEITDIWNIWQRSDEYSSGLLVPFLAVYILWSRRDQFASCRIKPSNWGLLAFICAQAVRLFGLFFMYGSAERLSIILSIASLVLLLFGWQLFRKVLSTLVFLGLMFPLPRSIHYSVMLPLQTWATSSAVFCLEMIGYPVVREGNVIHISNTTVAVAEACNGLRMIMAFFVISGLVVLLVKRTWWEKLIVLVSSIPIGLLCNTVRLTTTAIAFTMLPGEYWEKIFHDFGGYAMMPLALGLIVLELQLLKKLTTLPAEKQIALTNK